MESNSDAFGIMRGAFAIIRRAFTIISGAFAIIRSGSSIIRGAFNIISIFFPCIGFKDCLNLVCDCAFCLCLWSAMTMTCFKKFYL